MEDKRYLGSITLWELAFYISVKLNNIVGFHIEPEDILRKKPSREELIFFFTRLCRKE